MEYQALIAELEENIGEKVDAIDALKSGWAGEVLSVSCLGGSKQFIVKMYHSSKSGRENIIHEWHGLQMLYTAGYPGPKPIQLVDHHTKIYIIIEKIVGELFWNVYQRQDENGRNELEDRFAKILVQLHQLDIDLLPVEKHETPYLINEIANIKKDIAENNLAAMNEVVSWLEKNIEKAASNKLSFIHRDYHPWNVIIDSQEKMYVIDWVWGIGDYRFDLAWTCELMERGDFIDFSNNVFASYQKAANQKIEHFEYFKVLATLRWLINVLTSLRNDDGLQGARKVEFDQFIGPLIERGIQQIKEITFIEMQI